MLDLKFQNAMQLYDIVVLDYGRYSVWLDGGISMKVEDLEPGLFEQSVQLRR